MQVLELLKKLRVDVFNDITINDSSKNFIIGKLNHTIMLIETGDLR